MKHLLNSINWQRKLKGTSSPKDEDVPECTVFFPSSLLMRKALFDHLTARGIQVYIWVLNEEHEYKRAFDLGATGVMTDYPTKLKEFLNNMSAWSTPDHWEESWSEKIWGKVC